MIEILRSRNATDLTSCSTALELKQLFVVTTTAAVEVLFPGSWLGMPTL